MPNSVLLPIECLKINSVLGKGSYGTVSKTMLSSREAVVKSISVDSYLLRAQICGELLARDLRYKYLVAILNVVCIGRETRVVMAYGGHMNLSDESIQSIGIVIVGISDVSRALDYLHAQLLVHQDIKGENILWDRVTYLARVADYGCVRRTHTWSKCHGTTALQPPEVKIKIRQGKSHLVRASVDAWSYGLFVMAALGKIVAGRGLERIIEDIKSDASHLLRYDASKRGRIYECTRETRRMAYNIRESL